MTNQNITESRFLAASGNALVLIIDYQEKLVPHIDGASAALDKTVKLARFAQMLSLPIVLTEQYPKGLGPTVPQLASALNEDIPILAKNTFSCLRDAGISDLLGRSGRSLIAVSGIETHICVAQTVCDLVASSYRVHVLSDCVGARSQLDHNVGLGKMHDAGAVISTLEAFMYEILVSCKHPEFKRFVAEIVKG